MPRRSFLLFFLLSIFPADSPVFVVLYIIRLFSYRSFLPRFFLTRRENMVLYYYSYDE